MATLDRATISALRRSANGMHLSNNPYVNNMTIPQMKKARELLKGKLENSDLSPSIQTKFKKMEAQYAMAMDKIQKMYDMTMANASPAVKSALGGKRNLITLQQVLAGRATSNHKFDKADNLSYGAMAKTADFFSELNKHINLAKVGLGVGIGMAGLGAISLIPGSMPAIGAFLAANPAFTALVAGGAAIALAVKVVPAIYKAYKKVQENEMALHSAKADMNEEAYEVQEEARKAQEAEDEKERMNTGVLNAGDFAPDKFAANKDALVSRLMADENLYKTLLNSGNLSGQALVNLKRANLEARKKTNEMSAEDKKVDKEGREINESSASNEIVQAFQDGKSRYEIKEILKNNPYLYDEASKSDYLTDKEKSILTELKESVDLENKLDSEKENRIHDIVYAVENGNDDDIKKALGSASQDEIKEARKQLKGDDKTKLDEIIANKASENASVAELVNKVRSAADVEAIKTALAGVSRDTYEATYNSPKLTDKQKESLKEAWEKLNAQTNEKSEIPEEQVLFNKFNEVRNNEAELTQFKKEITKRLRSGEAATKPYLNAISKLVALQEEYYRETGTETDKSNYHKDVVEGKTKAHVDYRVLYDKFNEISDEKGLGAFEEKLKTAKLSNTERKTIEEWIKLKEQELQAQNASKENS